MANSSIAALPGRCDGAHCGARAACPSSTREVTWQDVWEPCSLPALRSAPACNMHAAAARLAADSKLEPQQPFAGLRRCPFHVLPSIH